MSSDQSSIINHQSSIAEWRWAAIVGIIILALTFIPYTLGWLNSSPEQAFTGSFFMQGDAYSYLAKMRLGAQGRWLFQDVYAVEPHVDTLVYFSYILAGHIAGLIGGPRPSTGLLVAIFHTWRVLGAALLMWALYRFYAVLLPEVRQRRLAYFLALVGGGLGGLLALLGYGVIDGYRLIDLYLGEAYGFIALLAWPHVLTARACALLAVLHLFPLLEENKGRWQDAAVIGVLWLVMALCVPFYLLVAAAVVAVWLVLLVVRKQSVPWKGILWGGLAGLPAGLANVATLLMIRGDAVYDSWNRQNSLSAVPVWNFALVYGLPLLLAGIGGYIAWHKRLRLTELCLGWIIAATGLVLVPLNIQLRLIEGAYIPLWGLAVLGLYWLLRRLHSSWLRRIFLGSFLAVSLLTTSFLILGSSAVVSNNGAEGIFISGDLDATLEWLNHHASFDAVLLASEPVGVYAPARAGVRSVVGHGFETPDFERKEAEVRAFYSGDMSDRQRIALLECYHVDYILSGPDDREWACQDDACAGVLVNFDVLPVQVVFRQGDYTLYEVIDE
ncbi:MAG: hypothetical protein JXB30_11065 [Anaerolineae bacterium]|nr:hypothetical protein [Anaerolineae bacterium]